MTKMVDVDKLSDAELQTKLQEFGFPVMPITGTTRKVMAKKLKMLMENRSKVATESGGRRSLGRYSSEEESDTDVKNVKKKDNRRATMAAPLMQPPTSTVKPKKSSRFNESVEPEVREIPIRKEVKTSTLSSRTQKIIQTSQDEFDTGSESESDIVGNNYVTKRSSSTEFSRSSPIQPSVSSSYTSRYSPPESAESSYTSIRNSAYNNSSPSRISSYNSPSLASEYAADRLNQIRSRLSLATGYDSPSSYTSVEKEETPFLSNFTKRLSSLSKPESDNDRCYKNDVIKEHDTNGSSLYARTHLSSLRAARNREPTYSRLNNQNNILKNNFVSFAVLGGAALFFVLLAIMYLGMKSDTSIAPAGSTIPHCLRDDQKRNVNCILEDDVTNAINLLQVLRQELQKRAVANRCFDPTIKAHMTESEIINFCRSNFAIDSEEAIKRDLNNLEILIFHNPQWGLSIVQKENNNGQVSEKDIAENMEQVVFNRDHKLTSLIIFQPELPWKCSFYKTFHITLKAILFVTLIFVILYSVNWLVKYYNHHVQKQKDEIGFMVERIIDILQSSISDNDSENFVVINHVRDMILPVKDREKKERTWAKAVKYINENESRVRTEVQEVQGEPFEVWRWIGSTNLSMSGDRSDYIYRKGRRIVDTQYLIMEVLKFPHKRLRFCKSSDVDIKNEIREGLLSVFLLHCRSCQREHPVCSEDPELELMNVNQAFVAGIVSLGMSLYHLNELCGSLQIPKISGKSYNVYLDELFEIYNESLTESEKSRDDSWKKVKEESADITSEKVEDEKPDEAWSRRILRSSTPKVLLDQTSEINLKMQIFLEELKKSPDQIKLLSKQTLDQSENLLWHEERRKRLTASNFGRIVKLLPSTDRSKIVEELLHPNFTGNIYTRYGKDNESKAIKDFERVIGEGVIACGLFVHPEHPYLAATPDGLLGERCIVEIKCPYKAKDFMPEEAIKRKLIQFANIEDGALSLKKNDKYYLQVQGQLFVTGRESCYFVIWTPHGLIYEKIYRDEDCWEGMLPKLKEFYFEHMLPKILVEN